MDRIRIRGGRQLKGEIRISGSKNASLPLMVTALLSDKKLILHNVPRLADITTMVQLLKQHGVEIDAAPGENGHARGTTLTLQAAKISSTTAPYDIVRKMRASVLVLGALLARDGVARVSLPGGCAIGARPVDLHIAGLKAMGAEIDIDGGYLVAKAPKGLNGARFTFPKVSVGATENLMMAAALAKGTTVLDNAAREPEITDLAHCLVAMGVPMNGIGTETLTIQGVETLEGATHSVIPDRIETGTYAMAVAMTAGDVELVGGRLELIETAAHEPAYGGRQPGEDRSRPARAADQRRSARRRRDDRALSRLPDRPAGADDGDDDPRRGRLDDHRDDLREPLHARAGAVAHGRQHQHPPRNRRWCAACRSCAAPVMATDLRASVSLVLAALAAEGDTTVNRVYHLDRGYERLEEKLAACGADIERLKR